MATYKVIVVTTESVVVDDSDPKWGVVENWLDAMQAVDKLLDHPGGLAAAPDYNKTVIYSVDHY